MQANETLFREMLHHTSVHVCVASAQAAWTAVRAEFAVPKYPYRQAIFMSQRRSIGLYILTLSRDPKGSTADWQRKTASHMLN